METDVDFQPIIQYFSTEEEPLSVCYPGIPPIYDKEMCHFRPESGSDQNPGFVLVCPIKKLDAPRIIHHGNHPTKETVDYRIALPEAWPGTGSPRLKILLMHGDREIYIWDGRAIPTQSSYRFQGQGTQTGQLDSDHDS